MGVYVHQNIYKKAPGALLKQDTNITPSTAQRTLRKGDGEPTGRSAMKCCLMARTRLLVSEGCCW